MIPKSRQLLNEAGRGWELLLGWACTLVSLLFGGALVFLLYIVGWRNPRQHNSQDLLKPDTLAIFIILLVIALAFSTFACRLLQRSKAKRPKRLMSPLVLRVWGVFFLLGAVLVCLDAIVHRIGRNCCISGMSLEDRSRWRLRHSSWRTDGKTRTP